MNKNKIGIVQGRLSPTINNKIQAFPFHTWQDEFTIAKKIGFYGIEWVMDSIDWELNPILSDEGCKEVINLSKETGIEIISLDPLYLTERGLLSNSYSIIKERLSVMKKLIPNCNRVGMKYILMPVFIGPNLELVKRLKSKENRKYVISFLKETIKIAEDNNLKIALETALNADEILNLIDEMNTKSILVCLDTGNSSYFDHNILSDIKKLSSYIVEVHIKDHSKKNSLGEYTTKYNSVNLGSGDVDFPSIFKELENSEYKGPFILQMARGKNHLKVVESALDYTKKFL